MKTNEKEIDKLLALLDHDSHGIQYQDNRIAKESINMGFIKYYDESNQIYKDFAHNHFYCRITEEGSRTLNRYGGFENILKYDRASRVCLMY